MNPLNRSRRSGNNTPGNNAPENNASRNNRSTRSAVYRIGSSLSRLTGRKPPHIITTTRQVIDMPLSQLRQIPPHLWKFKNINDANTALESAKIVLINNIKKQKYGNLTQKQIKNLNNEVNRHVEANAIGKIKKLKNTQALLARSLTNVREQANNHKLRHSALKKRQANLRQSINNRSSRSTHSTKNLSVENVKSSSLANDTNRVEITRLKEKNMELILQLDPEERKDILKYMNELKTMGKPLLDQLQEINRMIRIYINPNNPNNVH